MSANITNIWTYNLVNGSISIDETYGLSVLSIMLISGSATFTGTQAINSNGPSAIAMQIGIPITLTASNNYAIALNVDATSGAVQLVGKK